MNNGQSKWRITTLNSPGMGHANPSQRMAIFKTLLENPDDYIAEWCISEITQKILNWINAKMPMIIPDERDILLLKAKAELDHLDNTICYFHIYSNPDSKSFDPEKARKELEYSNIYPDNYDQTIDSTVNYWIRDLASIHIGDCTCVPCSCTKCHAENHLGIDTIKGLGKHQAAKISGAFDNPAILTCDDCIDHLENAPAYKPKNDWTDAHIPRWTQERKDAIAWLKEYRKEKLGR